MAEAMFSRALANGIFNPKQITISEPIEERRNQIADQYGVSVTEENKKAVDRASFIVISVKPQQLKNVYEDLEGYLDPSQTVVSIAAGVPLKAITSGLKHDSIIRVMPNTPAQIGKGVSVWTATISVSEEAKKMTTALLDAMGTQYYVDNESYIDMATAISGSGPAYLFAFTEALTDAALSLGIEPEIALNLVIGTIAGSSMLMEGNNLSPSRLREMVTSPGGTTAAALATLNEANFHGLVQAAAFAAYERAQALGREA